jgi:hypothetical protein
MVPITLTYPLHPLTGSTVSVNVTRERTGKGNLTTMTDQYLITNEPRTVRNRIDQRREEIRKEKTMTTETITLDDLKAGLYKLSSPTHGISIDAAVLFKAALESREHWEKGDIVKSGSGNIFKRRGDGDWENIVGRPYTDRPEIVSDKNITRPLTLIGKSVLWVTPYTVKWMGLYGSLSLTTKTTT